MTTRNRQPRTLRAADEDDAYRVEKPHSSAYIYNQAYPKRTALLEENDTKKTRRFKQRYFDRTTFVICACLLFILLFGGWWLFSTISTWWTNWQDDLHYGNPRTSQVDQFTGLGDSPTLPDHFIVVNLNGRVVVVQLNLQHPELDQTYGITTTDPKTPVSIYFRQQGTTLALYVVIGASTLYTVELVSDGKQKFVSPH